MRLSLILGLISIVFSLQAFAVDEDDVLHAVFVSFQEPGVLSVEYIESQREVLISAAKEGNKIARIVTDRGASDTVGSFSESLPAHLVSR